MTRALSFLLLMLGAAPAPFDSARPCLAQDKQEERGGLDFPNDVLPHLTKAGCNAGACHGSATGQKGFKLSLLGYDPAWDYAAITRELRGRRVDLAEPEKSLLLRKPTKQLKHGGGKAMGEDSEAYRTIVEWLRSGAPFRSAKPVELARISAEPGRVTAHYADGSTRDVTRLALLTSNDDAIADPDGRVKTAGETSIMVRYGGQVAAVVAGRPFGPKVDVTGRRNFIDDFVNDKLSRYGLPPLAAGDDATFLRRVTIDALGTIPAPDDVRGFDGNRDRLVDALLARPEFTDYWSARWAGVFQAKNDAYRDWIRDRFAEPYDQTVRRLLSQEQHLYFAIGDPKQLAEFVGQSLLGSRWMCAQCHNHPFERFTQHDYYSMAAFFARVRVRENRVFLEPRGELELHGKPVLPPFGSSADRREDLARWVTDSDAFARATANRVWAMLMGRGLVEPVDDMRASNPATHPELLEALAREFRKDFSLRRLVATVMKSAAYARKCGKGDPFYASRIAKPLDGDVLSRAISQAARGTLPPDAVLAGETLARTLHLMNSAEIDRLLVSDTVENLYLRALSRPPTAAEKSHWTGTDDAYLKDLFWALLNSKEFGTNH
ncbi:MAG: DUF1549 domain-containing protein [Planctomycetes bacterium]|nr:DUF1549 domain-containing protein [Planctomycetota bacterium]